MPVEILDDDTGFRHHLAAGGILQHRKFADTPQLQARLNPKRGIFV
jgi:hypothetical protein